MHPWKVNLMSDLHPTGKSRNPDTSYLVRKVALVATGILSGYALYSLLLRHLSESQLYQIAALLAAAAAAAGILYWGDRVFLRPILAKASRTSATTAAGLSVAIGIIAAVQFPATSRTAALLGVDILPAGIYTLLNGSAVFAVVSLSFYFLLLFLLSKDPGDTPRFLTAGIMLALLVTVGLLVYDDYGVSWDEFVQRRHGLVNLKYILSRVHPGYAELFFGQLPDLHEYDARYYGAVFQLPLAMVEHLNDIQNPERLFLRHMVTFGVYAAGTAGFFLAAEVIFRSWRYAAAGMLLFVLSPRIFADGFYNSKDAIFLAVFTIAFYFGAASVSRPSRGNLLAFAVFSAAAANLRYIGVFLYAVLIAGILVNQLMRKTYRHIVPVLLSTLVFLGFYILITPASWGNPLQFFLSAVDTFSDYPWKGSVMYMGEYIPGSEVPWHYLPVWIMLTTPSAVLLLLTVGVLRCLVPRRPKEMDREGYILQWAVMILLFVPVLAAILMGSTLYNGWRQFFFLYTPLVLLSTLGLKSILGFLSSRQGVLSRLARPAVILLLAVNFVYLAGWMIRWHPFQNVYFNPLSEALLGGAEGFERDYWGLSYRMGLEYILEHDPADEIRIEPSYTGEKTPLRNNRALLAPEDQARIVLADSGGDGDYIFYRYAYPLDFEGDPVYTIAVDGLPVLSIYSRH